MKNNETDLLIDLDDDITAFMHTMYPEPEPDGGNEDVPYISSEELEEALEIKSRQQVGLFDVVEKITEAAIDPIISQSHKFDLFNTTGIMLYEEVQHEETPAIIGQDIINIRALSGKKRKEADEALRAATVEFLNNASEKCIYIQGNVPSSKNNKDIGSYLKRNEKGELVRHSTLINSKRVQKYEKDKAGYFLQHKVHFLNLTRHLPLPLRIEFTFMRDTLRRFDFNNASQLLADMMVKNGWIPDDDSVHFIPVFNSTVYYHSEMAGVLIRVID